MVTRALVTGVTGQDGSYLAELLLSKTYEVHCIVRPESLQHVKLLPHYLQALLPRLHLHPADLGDPDAVREICREAAPNEIYHLGGPTRVDSNVSGGATVFQVIFGSTKALLDHLTDAPDTSLFFAGTSEMFGNPDSSPQTESSARNPRSIYGFAKLSAADLISNYRERFRVRASTGILYNHESPRRESFFLSRKVTRTLARVKLGLLPHVSLGNLDALRDWSYAPDFVDAMHKVTSTGKSGDYVFSSGRTHSVRELVSIVCETLGLELDHCVVQDSNFYRPVDAVTLCGNSSKLIAETGWKPVKPFVDMIREMALADLTLESANANVAS